MEMLSEHTLEGWFEGYVLTGRHGLLATYEAFVHVIDSMFNQHAKWLEKAKSELDWRAPVPSVNLLITSLVWRQDHNGFTHQDPGFLDVVTNKSPEVVRIYLPPDANCLLSVMDHCLRSRDYINVIVADKQPHLQYLDMEAGACALHQGYRHLGLGIDGQEQRTGRGDGLRRRHRHDGIARRRRDTEGTFPRPQDPLRQRGGPVPADARHRSSARFVRSRFRFHFLAREAGHLQLPLVSVARSQAHVQPHESREHACAWLSRARQHQHAVRAGDHQPGRPLFAMPSM
jgi:hypothetical protein